MLNQGSGRGPRMVTKSTWSTSKAFTDPFFDDTLIGDDSRNEIYGLGGPDDIQGLAGDDFLDGGSGGGDRVDGGDDFDTCFGELMFSCEDGALLLRD